MGRLGDDGGVVVLDFAVVRARFGERWAARRDIVCSRLEQTIVEAVDGAAMVVRTAEISYLLSFFEISGLDVQARAFRIMEDALSYYCGGYSPDDLLLFMVDDISETGVSGKRISKDAAPPPRSGAPPPASGASGPLVGSTTVSLQCNNERINLEFEFQNLLDLQRDRVIGTRFAGKLFRFGLGQSMSLAELTALPTSSLLQVDVQTTLRVIENVREARLKGVAVLPLHLTSVTSTHARGQLLRLLRTLTPEESGRLVVELIGCENGTPLSRIVDAKVMIRPFCRTVFGQATMSRHSMEVLKASQVDALTISARELGMTERKVAAGVLAFGQAVRGFAKLAVLTDAPTADFGPICTVAGLTHLAAA